MASAEHEQGDRLNDYLDARARGDDSTVRHLDPSDVAAARRFFAHDDAPPPSADLATQIWEDLMNQAALTGRIPLTRLPVTPPARNGRTQPRPWRASMPSRSVSRLPRRLGLVHLATAALLLLTIGFGFFVFGPGRPDRPAKIPAAVGPATPTAEVTTFTRSGHPIIGTWLIDNDPANPGTNINTAIYDADGTYVDYQSFPGVGIGTWRATGERTAELVTSSQRHDGHDDLVALEAVFAPDYVPTGHSFTDSPLATLWLSIEVDESGNTMTITGLYEVRQADGSILFENEPYMGSATRMVPVVPTDAATPAA